MALEYEYDSYSGTDRGSYRFTENQRKAWRLFVDVEILSTTQVEYQNNKTPQPREHLGYAELLHGASWAEGWQLEYPRMRLVDRANWPIIFAQWERRLNWYLFDIAQTIVTIEEFLGLPQIVSIPPPEMIEMWALPDTVLKVNLGSPGAFIIHVWWLERNLVSGRGEIVPSDATDPTDGLDEFPRPERRPSDDPYPDGHERDDDNPDSDPRDYPNPPQPPEPEPEPGQESIQYRVTLSFLRGGAPQTAVRTGLGPVSGICFGSPVSGFLPVGVQFSTGCVTNGPGQGFTTVSEQGTVQIVSIEAV